MRVEHVYDFSAPLVEARRAVTIEISVQKNKKCDHDGKNNNDQCILLLATVLAPCTRSSNTILLSANIVPYTLLTMMGPKRIQMVLSIV
jgi:hypothetical protein